MRLVFVFVVLLAWPSPTVADETPPMPLAKAAGAFKKAMKSKLSDERMAAFEVLRDVRDPEVMTLIAEGVETLKKNRVKIAKSQTATQAAFEKHVNDGHKLNKRWEASRKTAKDMKAFNKRDRRISKARDAAYEKLHTLENDYARNEATIQSAASAAGHILESIAKAQAAAQKANDKEAAAKHEKLGKAAMEKLAARWLESPGIDDRLRWIHVVWAVDQPWVAQRLHGVLRDEAQLPPVRGAAMSALGLREDTKVLNVAIEFLKGPPDQFTMIAAAIQTLRRLHLKASIPPLFEFLKRQDIERLRGDAHLTLQSLTGEKHGPYFDPWAAWWQKEGEKFTMPPTPADIQKLTAPKEGATFYGIHTFSKRTLYIVDISGSMDYVSKTSGSKTKMELLRKELTGTVTSLDENARFGVIFFNHQVLPWQGIREATEPVKKQFSKYMEDLKPVGGTNIFDALEAGFKMADAQSGRPKLDTIYFLADGKPVGGKVHEPDRILTRVREWNATAHLTIHVIGIGADHDKEFCEELARIGNGTYLAR